MRPGWVYHNKKWRFKGGSWMIENQRGLNIACRIEAHCLAVRTVQILPPSPANADISSIYLYGA